MEKIEAERILKENGFRQTVSAPSHVVDMQRSSPYNRIILYKGQLAKLTRKMLETLMEYPIGSTERDEVWNTMERGERGR